MFFSKKKPTINSISIPTFGWSKISNDNYLKEWVNPEETAVLSIDFFDIEPDLPTAKNVDALRSFYREHVRGSSGIIEVDIVTLDKYNASKTILKVSQGEMKGMTYIASLIIPFKNYSYVVKVVAIEVGMTGLRDTSVFTELMMAGKIKIEDGGLSGGYFYPYQKDGDDQYENEILMNQSEKEVYDEEYPTHPLSIVRRIIKEIENSIEFGKELDKVDKFEK